MKTLEAISQKKNVRGEVRTKPTCLLKVEINAKIFFGMLACLEIFLSCKRVARQLQDEGVTAQGTEEINDVLLNHI